MKRSQLFISGCLIFSVCCGMSKCNLDNPGPVTTVHGIVTDGATGKPVPNLKFELVYYQIEPNNTVTTNSDGSYSITFTPVDKFAQYTVVTGALSPQYHTIQIPRIVLGINNDVDFKVFKQINLTIHLVNNSNQGKTNFYLGIASNYYNTTIQLANNLKIDTTFNFPASHLMKYTFESEFLNIYSTDTTTVKYFKNITTGENDTTVNIINP